MNDSTKGQGTMNNRNQSVVGGVWRYLAVLGVAAILAWPVMPSLAADAAQKQFDSPEHAVDALIAAVRSGRTADLLAIFGPQGKSLVESGDAVADRNGRARFVASYDKSHS